MHNLAVIPARSGSKGLANKNIKELLGKPLLAYSIKAANDSLLFDEVMVSTDSQRYADVARKYGANVPFLRSVDNSGDFSSSWDAVREVLREYEKRDIFFDTVCLLQPTSPLRDEENIKEAYQLYVDKKATTVISVCEAEHSPKWCNVLDSSLSMNNFLSQNIQIARQQLDTYYRLNGAIYIVDTDKLKQNRNLYDENSYAYVMSQKNSVDIDSEIDFLLAETILKRGKE